MMRFTITLAFAISLLPAGTLHAQVLNDLKLDWSNANNPNGAWTYREGNNALPFVASMQSMLGGWSVAQPGWARSENGNDRIPFWFQSNGSEQFARDFIAGDIVVHSTDPGSGAGNGPGNVIWTSAIAGQIDVTGNTWMGRDIGRSNDWSIWKNNVLLTSGSLFTGDPFDRANPFDFSTGSGGASALTSISVSPGDVIMFQVDKTSSDGDFVGVNLTISAVPEPTTFALLGSLAAGLGWVTWRRRQKVAAESDQPINRRG